MLARHEKCTRDSETHTHEIDSVWIGCKVIVDYELDACVLAAGGGGASARREN